MVLPKRAIIYGDSITEGINAQFFNYDSASCGRAATLGAAAAPRSWAFGFGEAMQAEIDEGVKVIVQFPVPRFQRGSLYGKEREGG